jgi:hypothetical protein
MTTETPAPRMASEVCPDEVMALKAYSGGKRQAVRSAPESCACERKRERLTDLVEASFWTEDGEGAVERGSRHCESERGRRSAIARLELLRLHRSACLAVFLVSLGSDLEWYAGAGGWAAYERRHLVPGDAHSERVAGGCCGECGALAHENASAQVAVRCSTGRCARGSLRASWSR